MLYSIANEFVKISETRGTIQNTSSVYTVEVSDKATPDSGILLYPLNKMSFNGEVYLRCIGGCAPVRVVSFIVIPCNGAQSGGGSSDPTPVDPTPVDPTPSDPTAQYLIVDSPFSSDLTDNCGVVWNPTGTVTVDAGAAQFNSSSSCLISAEKLTFGGQDFTINLDVNLRGNASWSGIFTSVETMSVSESGEPLDNHLGVISLYTGSGAEIYFHVTDANGNNIKADYASANIFDNIWHNIRIVYEHNAPTLKFFIDGQTKLTYSLLIERLARNFGIFYSSKLVGSARDLKIWDGVAILPEE